MKKTALAIGILLFLTCNFYGQESSIKMATEKKEKDIKIEIKDRRNLKVFIDGKEYDNDIIDIIDPSKIESINVLKGEKAMNKYNSPKVIEIFTKDSKSKITIRHTDLIEDKVSGEPLYIVDGELKDKEFIEDLSPNLIISITVLKDDKSKKEYKTDVGVIMISTKKKK